jgi:hypothetical protein
MYNIPQRGTPSWKLSGTLHGLSTVIVAFLGMQMTAMAQLEFLENP